MSYLANPQCEFCLIQFDMKLLVDNGQNDIL